MAPPPPTPRCKVTKYTLNISMYCLYHNCGIIVLCSLYLYICSSYLNIIIYDVLCSFCSTYLHGFMRINELETNQIPVIKNTE